MITVIGSVNLDLVARGQTLPTPGETVSGARLARYPGGKGANQALALRRLGAQVRLVACTGEDELAVQALSLLRSDGVDLSRIQTTGHEPTGVALIAVDMHGENQIVVCPGANARLDLTAATCPDITHMMGVLEVPAEALLTAARRASGFIAFNLAPALDVPADLLQTANLLIVNETEEAFYGDKLHQGKARVAVSRGAAGAELLERGKRIAACAPPPVDVVDTTGAGDAFCAALCHSLIERQPPEEALSRAVAAGALACTQPGAQTSLPRMDAVDRLMKTMA